MTRLNEEKYKQRKRHVVSILPIGGFKNLWPCINVKNDKRPMQCNDESSTKMIRKLREQERVASNLIASCSATGDYYYKPAYLATAREHTSERIREVSNVLVYELCGV